MRVLLSLVAVAVGVGLPGCGAADEGKPRTDAVRGVEVDEVRADVLAAVLKEQTDKVVVVDFWATWCVPCVKNFPHLVELHEKYAGKGVVCVSVSMDKQGREKEYADEDGRGKVARFLREQKAAFPNFIVADPDGDERRLGELFGKGDGLPYVCVFDKAGRLIWNSETARTRDAAVPAAVEKVVVELLK